MYGERTEIWRARRLEEGGRGGKKSEAWLEEWWAKPVKQ